MVLNKQNYRIWEWDNSNIENNKKYIFLIKLPNTTDIGFSEDEPAILEKGLNYIEGRAPVSNDFKYLMAAVLSSQRWYISSENVTKDQSIIRYKWCCDVAMFEQLFHSIYYRLLFYIIFCFRAEPTGYLKIVLIPFQYEPLNIPCATTYFCNFRRNLFITIFNYLLNVNNNCRNITIITSVVFFLIRSVIVPEIFAKKFHSSLLYQFKNSEKKFSKFRYQYISKFHLTNKI